MQLFGFLVFAMIAFMVGFAFDLGGTVSFLIFLLIALVGATVRVFTPLIEWARGPAAKL